MSPFTIVRPSKPWRGGSGSWHQTELIRDIRDARTEMARGEGIEHASVVTELRSMLER